MYIFIDIETLPNLAAGDIPEPEMEELTCPKSLKKADSITAWWASPERFDDLAELKEKRIDQWRKTALDPWEGQIYCIAWQLYEPGLIEEETQTLYSLDEKMLLTMFYEKLMEHEQKITQKLSVSTFVGYNIRNFDNPYLRLHAIKHGLTNLAKILPTRRFHDRIDDVMEMALITTRVTADKYVSMDKVLKFFGYEGKDADIDGSKVYDFYLAGRHEEVAAYCGRDVDKTKLLHTILS